MLAIRTYVVARDFVDHLERMELMDYQAQEECQEKWYIYRLYMYEYVHLY